MSEEIKNTPEDTVEKENDAEAVIEEISTEEIIAEEPAAEAVAPAPVMKEKKHRLSYEKRKGLYGYGFIAIWALGTIYFIILPLIESLIYSFNKTEVTQGGMKMSQKSTTPRTTRAAFSLNFFVNFISFSLQKRAVQPLPYSSQIA